MFPHFSLVQLLIELNCIIYNSVETADSIDLSRNFKKILFLIQAFQDLQGKMIATTQQLKVSDMQVEQLGRQIQHSKLVSQDIQSLPKETKTYEGVGRM